MLVVGERRRWNSLATVGVALVVGAWLAIVVDDPSETVRRDPRRRARFANAAHDLAHAPHVLRSAVVPVDPVGAALVLAVVATFVAALATELIARRLEAPVGAIGPSVALCSSRSRALGSGRWAPTTACYTLVVVEYLVALQHTELETGARGSRAARTAGRSSSRGGASRARSSCSPRSRSARRVPARAARAWIRYRSLGSGSGSNILNVTSPLVSVGAKLNGKQSTERGLHRPDDRSPRATTGA